MPIFGTNSSINAGGYGFLGAPIRTVQSSVAPRNLTEGNVITVTVTSDDIEDGTTLYYTIRGTLGTITASDFLDNSLTGTFTINSNSGSFTKAIASDGVIEEGEGFVIDIRSNSHTGPLLETTQSVYIQGSQSTGVGGVDDGQGGSTFHDFGGDGNLVFDASTSTSYTYTAATNVRLKAYLWGQGGQGSSGGQGGYSYGTFNLLANEVLHIRLNYGSGSAGASSGWVGRENGGGLAGIFSSSTINQSNARLIAGGGGGGGLGHGSSPGGAGGGPSGGAGTNSSDTQIGSTGGGGASQSSGGSGGGAGGNTGSALQGGTGGNGQTNGHPNAGGGGGGGGGYYGGGGGGGGNDNGDTTRNASGGGGGSGYVHSSIANGFTGGFSNGQNHPDREDAGEAGQNAKVVFEGIFTLEYRGTANNDTYSVNVPANSTSMTAKLWGAGGAGVGECPASGTGLDGGNFSGGSGGHVEGTIPVTGGSTVTVWVGGSGTGTMPNSMASSGAGDGGGYSAVILNGFDNTADLLLAGGGGGAGQASNGGYGGGNGSGGGGSGGLGGPNSGGGGSQSGGGSAGSSSGNTANSGSYFSTGNYFNGYYRRSGGDSGGHGTYQGKRGGGGGAGYYGGGGGGGYDNNCTGGGGGGGSGIISGSWTNTVSQAGQTGTEGGRTARDTGDADYVAGYGGSGQNGLVIITFE